MSERGKVINLDEIVTQKGLPHSPDAERAVLGSLILENESLKKIQGVISASDFYSENNKLLFNLITNLISEGKAADLLIMVDKLGAGVEGIGGVTYLSSLIDAVPSARNIYHYAAIVLEKAQRRRLIISAGEITGRLLDSDQKLSEIQELAAKQFEKEKGIQFVEPDHWKTLDVANLHSWKCKPIKWQVKGIFAKGNFVLVAAPSQTGKTLFMLFLSMSMLHEGSLFGKYLITPVSKILYYVLEDPDRRIEARLKDMIKDFPSLPDSGRFIVKIAPGFNLVNGNTFDYLEHLISTEQFDVVIIDTYQKATPGISSFDDITQGPIFHALQDMTRKYDVTIFSVDHFRKTEAGKHRTATRDDIKGSGVKVQNSDSVIVLSEIEQRGDGSRKLLWDSGCKDGNPEKFYIDVSPEGSNNPKFQYAGDVSSAVAAKKEKAEKDKEKTLDVMRSGDWFTVKLLTQLTGFSDSTIGNHLKDPKIEHNGIKGRGSAYKLIQSTDPVKDEIPF